MTPMEKAAEALDERYPLRGGKTAWMEEARACVTTFLKAAAEDEETVGVLAAALDAWEQDHPEDVWTAFAAHGLRALAEEASK